MSALDMLNMNNGLKTTQGVLQKQLSGVDAAKKATPEQMNMNTAQAMLHGKENTLTPPKDAHEKAVRMNQETADAMMKGYIPIVKKDEPKPQPQQQEQPKRMSYSEMFKLLNPEETPEEKAKREKRERNKAKIAAVSDGLRALSNIYFATKGAKVVHNPQQDMTAAVNRRRQMVDAQREKNKAAWLSGYQRALALDEQANKNERTLAEQKRYHDMIADNNKDKSEQANRRLDQKDVQLEQSQQRLDLSKLRYETDAEYKDSLLKIKQATANGQLSHWQAQDAMAQLRESRIRSKANSSAGGNSTMAGYWYDYYSMMESPEGRKKIEEMKNRLQIRNVNQTNVRFIIDRINGRSSKTVSGSKPKTQQPKKPQAAAPKSNSSNKKKTTGVNWG